MSRSPNTEKSDSLRPGFLKKQQKDKRSLSVAERSAEDAVQEQPRLKSDQIDEEQMENFSTWRDEVEETMAPKSLPMPQQEILLPLHDYLSKTKIDGLLRSNVACILLSELMLQHGINIDWQTHLPVVLLSLILNMDQAQVPEVQNHCQRLLAHIIMKLCPHSLPSEVASSVISCKVDSSFHALVSSPISTLIKKEKAGATDAGTPISNGGISFPGDSGISSPSSATSSVRGSLLHNIEQSEPASASSGLSSPIVELNETGQSGDHAPPGSTPGTLNPLLHQLLNESVQTWGQDDVSPKNMALKGAEYLTSFVQETIKVFERELPSYNIKQRLAKEALKFVFSTPSKHHANRSLQVFRALELPLPPVLLRDLVQCILNCIADGNDPESQSHFIEILLTLLHSCDTPPPPERDKEDTRQQRSRSFTPDHSWRLSMGAPSSTHITAAPSSPSVSVSQCKSPVKFSSTQMAGLSLLPNLTKLPLSLPSHPKTPDSSQLSLKSSSSNDTVRGNTTPTTRPKKGHAHRRSGSVTLTKKMIEEVTQSAPSRMPMNSVLSPPPLPLSPPVGPVPQSPPNPNAQEKNPNQVPTPEGAELRRPHSAQIPLIPTSIHKTQSADMICQHQKSPYSTDPVAYTSAQSSNQPVNATEEWKNMLAQMFWIGVALLESDYEHEFLLAVQLIEKVLVHLPLQAKEGRFHIERYLYQMKWSAFSGIQNLLLKGLTSAVTSEATFQLLSSLTTVSNLFLVCGDPREDSGFAMNVVALLPHMVDQFGGSGCCESAQNIAQVCVDNYADRKKLQSLAHVMSLYSNHTYNKPVGTWVSVVCKYVHETFPHTIQQHLTFLIDMLERGPTVSHQSCLQIIYSLLSLSDVLLSSTESVDVKFNQDVLRAVSKFINSTKHWKEALNILKLAVSRCSAITLPTSGLPRSDLSDMDRIELPGRTLTFEFDVKGTPIVGEKKVNGSASLKKPATSSLSHHTSNSSAPSSSWKRPHLSQKRTYDRVHSIHPICGQHLPTQGEIMPSSSSHLTTHVTENSLSATQSGDEVLLEENPFDEDDEENSETNEEEEERESVVDDVYVLKNFDFLDEELGNEMDGFAMIQNQTSTLAVQDAEVGATEDDPDTYDITPHREASQDLEPSTIREEDEEDTDPVPLSSVEKFESDESSLSHTSSAQSVSPTTNGNISDAEEDAPPRKDQKSTSLSSLTRAKRRKLECKTITASVSEKNLDTYLAAGSSTESLGSDSLQKMFQSRNSHNNSAVRRSLYRCSPAMKQPGHLKAEEGETYLGSSSDSTDSEDENSSVPSKSSSDDSSDEADDARRSDHDALLNGIRHPPLKQMYSDIPHTPPPPPSNINSDPVDIPVAPPPPADVLISNNSSSHSDPPTFVGGVPGSPLRHGLSSHTSPHFIIPAIKTTQSSTNSFSESSFSKTPSPSREMTVTPSMLCERPTSVQSLSLPRYFAKSPSPKLKVAAAVSSFSTSTLPPWNAPSPLPPKMESGWQQHIESVSTDTNGTSVAETFDLFPALFRVLCIDFSKLSKEGCRHLGSQLSNLAEHFSSMVEQLPSQIQCPTCLTTRGTVEPVLEQLKFGVLELQEHFETYNSKKKNTLQCLDAVKSLKNRQNPASNTGRNSPSNEESESLGQKQLELCRLLYKLHFQLLLLLKSFNKLIQLVTQSSPDNKNITEQMNLLRKKLFAVENFSLERDKAPKTEEGGEVLTEMRSMTREEAELSLARNIAAENTAKAFNQLAVLRDLWPPEVFGAQEDAASDCLTKIYFKHLEEKSGGKFYAVLGSEDITHEMCEKLMEANSQIQQSLRSLSVIPPPDDSNATPRSKTRKTLL